MTETETETEREKALSDGNRGMRVPHLQGERLAWESRKQEPDAASGKRSPAHDRGEDVGQDALVVLERTASTTLILCDIVLIGKCSRWKFEPVGEDVAHDCRVGHNEERLGAQTYLSIVQGVHRGNWGRHND